MMTPRSSGTKVKATPESPVIGLSTSERIMGKVVKIKLPDEPKSDFEKDLAGDIFFANYKPDPKVLEEVAPTRKLNQALIDWAVSDPNWNNSDTRRNMPASMMASGMMWAAMTSDAAIQSALEKMRQAEEAKKKADELAEQAVDANKNGDLPGYVNLMNQAKEKDAEADKLAGQAAKSIERVKKDPLAQGTLSSTIKDANDEARNVNGVMRGWGLEPSSITSQEDAEEIIRYASQNAMKDIAKYIGRAKKTCASQISETKQSFITKVNEPHYTKDIRMMTAGSRMRLSPQAPDIIRFQALKQWQDYGLFGFRPKTSKVGFGHFIGLIDESGSMSHDGCIRAKSMMMGIVQGVRENLDSNRFYELIGFSSGHWAGGGWSRRTGSKLDYESFPTVTSDAGWKEHIDWCNKFMGGGTDFDAAFTLALERLDAAHKSGKTAVDLVFTSDGIAGLSPEVKAKFLSLKSVLSIRLTFFQFGDWENPVKELADLYFQLPDVYQLDDEKFIREISKITAEHFLSGFGGGD